MLKIFLGQSAYQKFYSNPIKLSTELQFDSGCHPVAYKWNYVMIYFNEVICSPQSVR